MTPHIRVVPAALLTVLTLSVTPAMAQQRERGPRSQDSSSNGGSSERAVPRGSAGGTRTEPRQERRESPPARAEAPRQQQRPAESPRADTRRDGQSQSGRDANRGNTNRGNPDVQRAVPRPEAPRYDNRRNDSRYDSRGSDSRRYDSRYNSRGYRNGRVIIVPRYERYAYVPRSYYRPYAFRPWFSIGFGIFAGYPVPYSYSYAYPVPVYGYSGYSAPRSVVIGPGSNAYGGVSLEIYPNDGAVFVDGVYAGEVREFDGSEQPLTLVPGPHRIEVQAQGYETLTFDVTIRPGEVVPYRGDLRRY